MPIDSEMQLGDLIYRCEKRPQREWAIESSGGWPLIIFAFLFWTLFGGCGTALGIVELIKLTGVPKQSLIGVPFLIIALCCMSVFVAALVWWTRRGLRLFASQEIEAHERGIRIIGSGKSISRDYSKIKNVYFGTSSQLANTAMNVSSFFKPSSGAAAKNLMNARLTVEFTDGKKVRVIVCRMVFEEKSIKRWMEILAAERPDLFAT